MSDSKQPAFPLPEVTALNRPYWDALAAGRLVYQRCGCGHRWLPAREQCPSCLSPDTAWEQASGRGTLLSWVVYRTAYHPAFEGRLPYVTAVVQLDEGPRLMTNIVPADAPLRADMPVTLRIEHEGDFALARFTPA